jgi:hypothetical protein
MKKFRVHVHHTSKMVYEVEADSEEAAVAIVKRNAVMRLHKDRVDFKSAIEVHKIDVL